MPVMELGEFLRSRGIIFLDDNPNQNKEKDDVLKSMGVIVESKSIILKDGDWCFVRNLDTKGDVEFTHVFYEIRDYGVFIISFDADGIVAEWTKARGFSLWSARPHYHHG